SVDQRVRRRVTRGPRTFSARPQAFVDSPFVTNLTLYAYEFPRQMARTRLHLVEGHGDLRHEIITRGVESGVEIAVSQGAERVQEGPQVGLVVLGAHSGMGRASRH